MRRFLILALALMVVPFFVQADEPKPDEILRDLAVKQEHMANQYRSFEQALLRFAMRLERSAKEEDRTRAVQLRKAIELAGKENVRGRFERVVLTLNQTKALSVGEMQGLLAEQKMLRADIAAILALMLDKDQYRDLKDRMATLRKIIAELDRTTREQKLVRTHTEAEKIERIDLAGMQVKVCKETEKVARLMGAPSDAKKLPEDSKDLRPLLRGAIKVVDATAYQQNAVAKIEKGQNAAASNEQDQSIRKLVDARRQLDELLHQLRAEEIERVLTALQYRCERMLAMQLNIFANTRVLEAAIVKNPGGTPARADLQRAVELAKLEDQIVQEVVKAIQLLEAEGTAVAFPEVFGQLRDDMKHVAQRLRKTDVGPVTQVIEHDIIATLEELIGAVKKALPIVNAPMPTPAPPGTGGPTGPSGNDTLIEKVAELKMIRSLQVRVNQRTRTYGSRYQGEQADQPVIRTELKNLADRQARIQDVTKKIAEEKNR